MGDVWLIVAGGWLLASALAKAAEPWLLDAAIESYGLIAPRLRGTVMVAAIGVEAAGAVSLMLPATPVGVIAGTALALVALAAVAWWGEQSGRVEECGCHGRLLRLSARASILVDAVVIALLALGWRSAAHGTDGLVTPILNVALSVCLGLLVAAISIACLRSAVLDMSPLRPGRPWPQRLVEIHAGQGAEDHLVVLLSPRCNTCLAWARRLSGTPSGTAADASRVTVLLAGTAADAAQFVVKTGTTAFVLPVDGSTYARLTPSAPRAYRVRERRIVERWVGTLPDTVAHEFTTPAAITKG